MEFLRSFKNRMINRDVLNQGRLRGIHMALLQCLETSSDLVGRKDYQPGEIALIQSYTHTPFSLFLRLLVSRNSVDIYSGGEGYPEFTLLRKLDGGYFLLDGFQLRHYGRKVHENIRFLPDILHNYSYAHFHNQVEAPGLTISRIS